MPALGLALGTPFSRIRAASATPPVANPLIWLDANQETFANNDPVGQFTDRSGNGNHFTSSGTARPTFKTNRINGRPSVLADGVDDGMLLASMGAQIEWTLFVVGRLVTDTGTVNLLSVNDYDPDGLYILMDYQAGSNETRINGNAGYVSPASCVIGTAYTWCLTSNGTTGTILASDNTSASNAADYSRTAEPMRLFRRGDGLYANFEIAELLFYGSVLDSTDRTTVWTYFNTRYATAIPATP